MVVDYLSILLCLSVPSLAIAVSPAAAGSVSAMSDLVAQLADEGIKTTAEAM